MLTALIAGLALQGEIQTIGSMREAMREGKIEGRTAIAPLAAKPHLYAIGPINGLSGEITVLDGVVHIGQVKAGKPEATVQKDVKAVFLAYSYVAKWTTSEQRTKAGLAEIADAIAKTKRTRTPFLITGEAERTDFHIMDYRPDGEQWSMAKHDAAKAKFGFEGRSVTLLGFYTEQESDAGLFVHHGERLHVHVVADSATGHLDGIALKPGWRLHLPAD
jgi:alpha-acetolactate decarboxylase